MINFSTTILQFESQGEKTGWSYITIPAAIAEQLQPGNRKSFRVKGKLDQHIISGISLLPMGEGDFIMPLNATLRKAIRKRKGDQLIVQLAVDTKPYQLNSLFTECLADEPAGLAYFQSLPRGHQNYFSKWIETAKSEPTREKRIAQAVSALSRKMGFSEMMREKKADRDDLMSS